MANAGRILILPKGDYDASATYEMLDLVFYNGTSWIAKKTVAGIEPNRTNGEYWQSVISFNRIETSITSEYSNKPIVLLRDSNVVNIYIDSLKNLVKDELTPIGAIPEEYRPRGVRIFLLQSPNGDIVRFTVSASGKLTAHLYTNGETLHNIVDTLTYVI